MPGITGIIGRGPNQDGDANIEKMVASMRHEPSYAVGTYVNNRIGLSAGWVCHAGSFSDCMPVWNETRDICLIFTGEHYADSSESACLKAAGHLFSEDDATSLVHLYEELGTKFVGTLNGTFSGLLVDLRQNKLLLFNDRYGLGRVYYYQDKDAFYFASEAKALLKVLPHLRELDMRSLGELFTCGCTLQNRSLFPGISLLPPGSLWSFTPAKGVSKDTYFDKTAWEQQPSLSASDYYTKLEETFTRILPRYFRGRQKVALSVTGGLDSRMIIAGIRRPPSELPCYTFGGMYRDSEDVRIGRLIAGLCQQPHGVITVDRSFFPEFLDQAKRCVYITDGTMDVSGSVGMVVNRKARDYAPVRMTGNYGSEILRGNVAFKAGRISESMFAREFLANLKKAAATYSEERGNCSQLSFITFKQVPWHHYSRLAEEQSQLTIRAPYLDNELVPLAYQAPPGLLLNKQLALRYTTDMNPALAGAPTDRGMLKRPPFIPTKAFALCKELRPKAEYYFDYGMPQWLAKVDRLLSSLHLERLFLGQQKYYHFRIWYRHELARHVKEVLLDPRTLARPYLNARIVEEIVNAHVQGTGNHTLEIHKLMTSEFIQRQLIEQN